MNKGLGIAAMAALLLASQAALAQFGGGPDRLRQCAATVFPAGNYNPCDPSQCTKVCQCSGGRDCFKSCERESKILFGPTSCRANIPPERLKR